MNKNFVWKVVCKDDRGSAALLPFDNTFYRQYKKDSIVYALKDSYGIFCFKSRTYARKFKRIFNYKMTIIKVKPIGIPFEPTVVAKHTTTEAITEFYNALWGLSVAVYFNDRNLTYPLPMGTVCYPAVEVLE